MNIIPSYWSAIAWCLTVVPVSYTHLYQQIRVIYDSYDMVTDYLVDCYNSHSRETYDIIPVTTLDLSPETEKLFRMDDYPERFFKWADKFILSLIHIFSR